MFFYNSSQVPNYKTLETTPKVEIEIAGAATQTPKSTMVDDVWSCNDDDGQIGPATITAE
jgi:hypothetical protein